MSEFEVSGLTPVASQRVKPPRVRESAVQLECKVNRVLDFKDRWGRVVGKGGGMGNTRCMAKQTSPNQAAVVICLRCCSRVWAVSCVW